MTQQSDLIRTAIQAERNAKRLAQWRLKMAIQAASPFTRHWPLPIWIMK